MYLLKELLSKTIEMNASDLHLTVGLPPTIRSNGNLIQLGVDKLLPHDMEEFSKEILCEKYDEYLKIGEFDTSYSVQGVGRFRVNIFKQRNSDAIAIRVIALKIPTLDELGHPTVLKEIVYSYGRHIQKAICICSIPVEEIIAQCCLQARGNEVPTLYVSS